METDPTLKMLLAEAGCPYDADSPEAVIWLHGRKVGIAQGEQRARDRYERELRLQKQRRLLPDVPQVLGGHARASVLTPQRRTEIARAAANATPG